MLVLTELHLTGGAPSFLPGSQQIDKPSTIGDIASDMGPTGIKKQPIKKQFASPQEESVEEAVL